MRVSEAGVGRRRVDRDACTARLALYGSPAYSGLNPFSNVRSIVDSVSFAPSFIPG